MTFLTLVNWPPRDYEQILVLEDNSALRAVRKSRSAELYSPNGMQSFSPVLRRGSYPGEAGVNRDQL